MSNIFTINSQRKPATNLPIHQIYDKKTSIIPTAKGHIYHMINRQKTNDNSSNKTSTIIVYLQQKMNHAKYIHFQQIIL